MQMGPRQSQSWLQLVWRRILAVQHVYIGLGFIVFAPLFDALSNHAESGDTDIKLELRLHQKFQSRIASADSVLADFTTDGCSGGMSAGWEYFATQPGVFRERHGSSPPWESCCVDHDRVYHNGGGEGLTAMESYSLRQQADDELRACVLSTAAKRSAQLQSDYSLSEKQVMRLYETIAASMHTAVRLGGMPCTGLAWRWGYGWPSCDQPESD